MSTLHGPPISIELFGRFEAAAATAKLNQIKRINMRKTLHSKSRLHFQVISQRGSASIQITGQVQLDISYFAKSGSLTVHVLRCAKLTPMSKRRTTSNP